MCYTSTTATPVTLLHLLYTCYTATEQVLRGYTIILPHLSRYLEYYIMPALKRIGVRDLCVHRVVDAFGGPVTYMQ